MPFADVPPELVAVQSYIARSLHTVQDLLEHELTSDLPPVVKLTDHVEKYRGKMIRPVLCAVFGLACDVDRRGMSAAELDACELPSRHASIAAVCELVHLATLVHDDVLDEAAIRRKSSTVNKLHGNETAVILGDYLFSAAFHLAAGLESQTASRMVAQVGMTLCSGELLQLWHREDFSLDEATYFEIVSRKTASLIAASCKFGAMFSGGTPEQIAAAETYGRLLGIAFQIQDDLLDLTGEERIVGKSVSKDLEKGKLTLPLIHHLRAASPMERGKTLLVLATASDRTEQAASELRRALASTGSIEFAKAKAESLVSEAVMAVCTLPPSPARQMLEEMARVAVTRAY